MNCFHNLKRISSHVKVVLLLLGIVVSLYFGVYTTVMTNNDHLYTATKLLRMSLNISPKMNLTNISVAGAPLHLEVKESAVRENFSKKALPTTNQRMCKIMPRWVDSLIAHKIPTDWENWEFRNTTPCPGLSFDNIPSTRQKVSLDCNKDNITDGLVTSWTNSTADIDHVQFGDKCLEKVIDTCCKDDKHVPNVVHYVWYANKELSFFNFVSFMSVLRYMKPCLILIHGDSVPHGKYWDYFVSISPNIILVNRTLLTHIFGNKLAFKEHGADVMRIEALKAYGGVYLDIDELLLRPLEPLRKYEHTQGYEESGFLLGNQLIMSKKNATFLQLWYDTYRHYKPGWTDNSLQMPVILAKKHPHTIHVDGFNFTRPNWPNRQQIFKGNYDWSTNYGMHLFVRDYKNDTNVDIIRTLNTTIGAVCRHVLFGNKELCSN